MKTKVLLIFLSIFISLNAQTTYYFSTSGNDANDGLSTGTPKQTLAALQTLLSSAVPGDSFLLKRDDTWTTRAGTYGLSITTCKGTPSNYIVIRDYGTGNKPKFNFSGTGRAISITGGNAALRPYYIKIENLHLTSSNQTSFPNDCLYIGSSYDTSTSPRDIIIDGVDIDNVGDGIRGEGGNLVNITVQNCLIQDNEENGIVIGSFGTVIKHNEIYNCGIYGLAHNIYMSDAVNGLIEGNTSANSVDGLKISNGRNIVVRDNTFHDNSYQNMQIGDRDSGIFGLDSCVIERNAFHSSPRLIEIKRQSTNEGNGTSRLYIRNNLFYNASYYGIYNSLNDFSDSYIVNNTFYNCLDAVKLGGDITNLTVKNNIFYNDAYPTGNLINFVNGTTGLNNTNLDYNLYYASVGNDTKIKSTTRTLAQFQAQYPAKELNGFSANPLINLVFNIEENSPAVNSGIDLSSFGVDDDFDGNPRPVGNGFDIGAFEFGSSTSGSTIRVNSKILLQGPFDSISMLTTLSSEGYIPLNQPYSFSPWNYTGSEFVTFVPYGVVDWVLLELRTGTSASTTVSRKAVFLKSDGTIVNLDGSSNPTFSMAEGSYYLVVMHRNHLSIMSANAISLSSNSSLYDFTTGPDKAYGTNPLANLGNGKWGMYAGDGDINGIVNLIDYESVGNFLFQSGYKFGDLDLNGIINIIDYGKTNLNLFRNSQVPN